ncbi:MAG: hypothetical protein C4331_04435 [Meiothermus sp.]
MPKVSFVSLELPEIGVPSEVPEIPDAVYQERFRRLEAAREGAGLDALALYADREHAANLGWLTGFTPRFEEALWLQVGGRTPVLLAGNECLSFAQTACILEAEFELYQPFSLPGQDRSKSNDLPALLREAGLGKGLRIGLIGWKPMAELDIPYWIVGAVEEVTGHEATNATHLLMDSEHGLRALLEPEMVRFCEYAAALTSESIKNLVHRLKPGLSEREAAGYLNSYGLELSCHPMVNFAQVIPSGLRSPRNRRAERGSYAQMAMGVIGSLTCRAGRLLKREDAAGADEDGYLGIVENYLHAVRAWYGSLEVGTPAGNAVEAVARAKNDLWDLALNPGHLLHLDEWLNSPFYTGSTVPLRSGMAVQQDLIPVPRQGNAVVNLEDGILLADGELRERLETLDPAMMRRIAERRRLMERLGYALSEDVLPLSNLAGAFFPFLLEPGTVTQFN